MPKVVTKYDYKRELEILKGYGNRYGTHVHVGLDGDRIEGIWMEVSPIMAFDKIKELSRDLGQGYDLSYLPNLQEVHIRKNE